MLAPWRLAAYEPSELISASRYWTVLQSPDSVKEISDFYTAELSRCGWTTTSSVVTGKGAMVVGRRGPHGATISINDVGSRTAITIASC
jgi:hypothetical protein